MAWLTPALIASFISSVVMFFVFLYLYHHERRTYLAVWSVSWGLYCVRFVFEILTVLHQGNTAVFVVNQMCSLWSGGLLLWGTYLFSGKKLNPLWIVIFLAGSFWTCISALSGLGFILTTTPAFVISAIANIATGIVLLNVKDVRGVVRSAAGWSFILWGLHKADYPFLRPLVWFAPWGYLLGASLSFIASLSMVLIYFQKARNDLKASEEKYRSIFDNSLEGIFQTTPEGRYLSVNPALARMYGYSSPEEMIGAVTDIEKQQYVVPEDRLRFKEALSIQGFVEGFETQIMRKDGNTVWISLGARAVKDPEGAVLYYEGTALDVTERKQADEKVRSSLKEKEVLLKEIHHRVKNNLQIIRSLLNMQSRYIRDPQDAESFKASMDRIKSMALIHDKLYRSENIARINFREYINDLVRELVMGYSADQGIELEMHVDLISFEIDHAIPLGLIVNELVSNALKHAFPGSVGGKIVIGLHGEDSLATLLVSDSGKGFPEDVDFMDTPSMGMQLVVALVEQLDGTIELNRDNGTEFRITFEIKGQGL